MTPGNLELRKALEDAARQVQEIEAQIALEESVVREFGTLRDRLNHATARYNEVEAAASKRINESVESCISSGADGLATRFVPDDVVLTNFAESVAKVQALDKYGGDLLAAFRKMTVGTLEQQIEEFTKANSKTLKKLKLI